MRARNTATGVVAELSALPATGWEPVEAPATSSGVAKKSPAAATENEGRRKRTGRKK